MPPKLSEVVKALESIKNGKKFDKNSPIFNSLVLTDLANGDGVTVEGDTFLNEYNTKAAMYGKVDLSLRIVNVPDKDMKKFTYGVAVSKRAQELYKKNSRFSVKD